MTCEDYDEEATSGENDRDGLLAKGAHWVSLFIASRPARLSAPFLPRELMRAITTLRLAVMNVVNARPSK